MPRNVRNFWVELSVDGRQSRVGTGPRSKDGGFELTVQVRDDGDILDALHIRGYRGSNNELILSVRPQADVSDKLEPLEDGLDRDDFAFRIRTNR